MKKITALILSLFSIPCLTQDINTSSSRNTVEGLAKITIDVPSFCTITNNSVFVLDGGDFVNTAIERSFTYNFNCNYGTSMNFYVGMGSNPNSTVEKRRMPLGGEAGDVEHYLEYSILAGTTLVGGQTPYPHFVGGHTDNWKNISFKLKIPAEQSNLIVGEYSDRLETIIEYF